MIGKNSYKGNRGRRWDFFVQDIFDAIQDIKALILKEKWKISHAGTSAIVDTVKLMSSIALNFYHSRKRGNLDVSWKILDSGSSPE